MNQLPAIRQAIIRTLDIILENEQRTVRGTLVADRIRLLDDLDNRLMEWENEILFESRKHAEEGRVRD